MYLYICSYFYYVLLIDAMKEELIQLRDQVNNYETASI